MGIEIPRKETRAFHDENSDFLDADTQKTRKPAFRIPGALVGVGATVILVGVGFLAVRALSGMEFSGDEEAEGQRFTDEFRKQYDWENDRRRANGDDPLPPLPAERPPVDPDATRMSGDSPEDTAGDSAPQEKEPKVTSSEVHKIMYELRQARTPEQCFAILRANPHIPVDAFIANEILMKAKSLSGAMEIFQQLNVPPDTHMLTTILRKVTSTQEGVKLLEWFVAEYPGLKPNSYTATSIMSSARSSGEAYAVMNQLMMQYPDTIRMDAPLKTTVFSRAQSLEDLKFHFEKLESQYPNRSFGRVGTSALYHKTAEFWKEPGASAFIDQIDARIAQSPALADNVSRHPNSMLNRSFALFAVGREKEAIDAIKQVLTSGGKLTIIDIQVLSNLAFTFLPPEHPLCAVLARTLEANNMHSILEHSLRGIARLNEVREEQVRHILDSMRKEHFGGGKFFDGTYDRPVDSNARRVVPKR